MNNPFQPHVIHRRGGIVRPPTSTPANKTEQALFLNDIVPGESHYDPSPAEVYEVKDLLMSLKPHLPLEIVDMVIDAAEYWPCSIASLKEETTAPNRGKADVLLLTTLGVGSYDAREHAARHKAHVARTRVAPSNWKSQLSWITGPISTFLGLNRDQSQDAESQSQSGAEHQEQPPVRGLQASPPPPQTSEPELRPPPPAGETQSLLGDNPPPPEVTQAPNPQSRSALAVINSLRRQGALPPRGRVYDDIATVSTEQAPPGLRPQPVPVAPEDVVQSPHRGRPCRKIVFLFSSRDQGWGGSSAHHGTHDGSYTWFTAKRRTPEQYERLQSIDMAERADQFHHEHYLPGPYMLQNNVTASQQYTNYRIVWSADDQPEEEASPAQPGEATAPDGTSRPLSALKQALKDAGRGEDTADGRFVRDLQPGDRIEIWASARFGGWVNFVAGFTVKVYWAV